MGNEMKPISCRARKMVVRHWDTGEEITAQDIGTKEDETAPTLIGHRGYRRRYYWADLAITT
jgi:hypothetical protein